MTLTLFDLTIITQTIFCKDCCVLFGFGFIFVILRFVGTKISSRQVICILHLWWCMLNFKRAPVYFIFLCVFYLKLEYKLGSIVFTIKSYISYLFIIL